MSSRTPSPNLIDFGNVAEDEKCFISFINGQDSSDEDSIRDLESPYDPCLVEQGESSKELDLENPNTKENLNQYMESVRPLFKYLDDLSVLDQYYTSESSTNFNSAEESDEQSLENIIGDDSFELFNMFLENYMDDIENIEEETCPSVIDSDESIGIDTIIFDRTSDTLEVEAEGSNSAHSVCPKSRMDLVLHKCKTNMTTIIDTSYLEFDTRLEESYGDLRIEIKRRAQNLFRKTIQEQSKQIYTKVLSEMGNLMSELAQNIDTVLSLSHWEESVNEKIRSNITKAICELEKSQKERSLVLFSNFMTDVDTIIENKLSRCANELIQAKAQAKLRTIEIALIDHKSKIDKKISNVENLFQTIQEKSNENSVNELSDEGMELLVIDQFADTVDNRIKSSKEWAKRVSNNIQILEDEITILKQDLDRINYVVREKTFETKFKGLEEKVVSIRDMAQQLENKYYQLREELKKIFFDIKEGTKIIHDRLAALESVDELIEARLKIDIQTSEKSIMKRLNDDHKEKMAQTIAVVKDEALKVFKRIETLEAVDEYLRQEFKLNEEEIMKRIENDKTMSNQIIQERIREAIHLYTMEYDEKLKQRTYELLQHYEERLNKLVDTSIGLESTTEEIKKTAEEKIRSFEIENQKLKESKNNQKENMVIKESIIYDLKLMAAHHESVASKLQENKTILEARVNDLKSERTKLENKIKEIENKFHESDRKQQINILANDEEIKRIKNESDEFKQKIRKIEADKIWYKRGFKIFAILVMILLFLALFLLFEPIDAGLVYYVSIRPQEY
ncbi:976_t:CDS:2 [Gigaspora margarita]|uniref:976_t:CDS:1 n=1 Tax=Gigaspora margarita TaxID=4874 RepID=A0ABN7VPP5_GIGMA|nr:976_t:CDS:2 [Gigaspora margarita]